MKNTLGDLNNYLFESLERLMDDSLTPEEMEREITRSKAVTAVAETVVHNGELQLKAMRYVDEFRPNAKPGDLPPVLTGATS